MNQLCFLFLLTTCVIGNQVAFALPDDPPAKKTEPESRFKITYPPNFDAKNKLTPVVFALHGYGGNMDGMHHVWKDACAEIGAILIVAEGSSKLDGGGRSWSGAEDAGKAIDAARAELRKKCKLDRSAPRVLTGMSQGCWATYALSTRYPQTWRRLIPVAGMYQAQNADGTLKPLEKEAMKRWRVYMMVGIKDKNELVVNNRWFASRLEEAGAALLAPFMDKRDASYALYAEMGHNFPGEGETMKAELQRALRFVLQPDEQDRKNWEAVDLQWEKKAKWLEKTPAKQVKPAAKKSKAPPRGDADKSDKKDPPGS